jgi:O-antigen ligase
MLRLVSPGSFAFHDAPALVPLTRWKPISVSPPDTLRGLLFLAGMSLLYGAVFREFQEERTRRRLAAVVVGTGLVVSLEGLLQAASGDTKIYGLWRPHWDWGVFGPYVNRNHFAGYVVMTIPIALAFAVESLQRLVANWRRRRRRGWIALGERDGSALVGRAAVAFALIVALLAAASRGGFTAFALTAFALPLVFRHSRQSAVVISAVAFFGVAWMGLGGIVHGFETRGVRASRLNLWQDAIRMVPDFPVLGAGFNAFGTAYPVYQTVDKGVWWGEAHNEYLQALVDTGVVGAVLTLSLIYVLFCNTIPAARKGALEAGLLGALLASAFHNLVDFNWQIPANAATFVALAGTALRSALGQPQLDPPAGAH